MAIAAGVVLITAVIIIVVIRNMSAPAVGSLNQTPPAKQEIVDPYKEPATYSGKSISFTYPAHYKIAPVKAGAGYQDAVNYISIDHTNKQISVSVSKDSLGNSSGVSFRKAHPELYVEARTRYGLSFTSTTKAAEAESTSFIQHGELLASVSLTGPSGTDLTGDTSTILSSLQWR